MKFIRPSTRNRMRFFIIMLFLVTAFSAGPAWSAAVKLEIFYLPHRPAMVVVDKVEQIASEYANMTVYKHSFDDPDTKKILEKYQLTGHIPVAIFINGENAFTVQGNLIHFRNFPKGDAFVPMFAGEWDYDDLRSVIQDMAGKK